MAAEPYQGHGQEDWRGSEVRLPEIKQERQRQGLAGLWRCRFLLCPALLLPVCVVVLQVMDGILYGNCTMIFCKIFS